MYVINWYLTPCIICFYTDKIFIDRFGFIVIFKVWSEVWVFLWIVWKIYCEYCYCWAERVVLVEAMIYLTSLSRLYEFDEALIEFWLYFDRDTFQSIHFTGENITSIESDFHFWQISWLQASALFLARVGSTFWKTTQFCARTPLTQWNQWQSIIKCAKVENKFLSFSLQDHKKASFWLGRTRIGSTGCELLVNVNQVHRILFRAYLYGRLLFITNLVSLHITSVCILLCIIGEFVMQDLLKRATEREKTIKRTMELLSILSKLTLNIYAFVSMIKHVIVMN